MENQNIKVTETRFERLPERYEDILVRKIKKLMVVQYDSSIIEALHSANPYVAIPLDIVKNQNFVKITREQGLFGLIRQNEIDTVKEQLK